IGPYPILWAIRPITCDLATSDKQHSIAEDAEKQKIIEMKHPGKARSLRLRQSSRDDRTMYNREREGPFVVATDCVSSRTAGAEAAQQWNIASNVEEFDHCAAAFFTISRDNYRDNLSLPRVRIEESLLFPTGDLGQRKLRLGAPQEDIFDESRKLAMDSPDVAGGGDSREALVNIGVLEVKSKSWPHDSKLLLHDRGDCVFTRHFRIRPNPGRKFFVTRLNCEINIMCEVAK
ncbi:hypothetical protein FOZ62_031825, partial [Perkinsus olseni]